MANKGIAEGTCVLHGNYFMDAPDSPCPACEDGLEVCHRCKTPLDDENPAVDCHDCGRPTLCQACAEDHACCQPDECLTCKAPTTLGCGTCPHGKDRTSAWLLNCKGK